MNHVWEFNGFDDDIDVQEYYCTNCGLYKEVYKRLDTNYDLYVKRFGADIVYWGLVDYTIIEPSCAEIMMKQILE